jgi:peptide/nickel transport system substrate-binding protein
MFKRNSLLGKKRYIGPEAKKLGYETHPYLPELADLLRQGRVNRRDFLRTATLLGMSATAAYAMAGSITGEGVAVKSAMAQSPKMGGSLRVAMAVQEMTDPATFDWVEKSNVARFIVEHLTRTGADNITRPYLAEGWEASEDLKTWRFTARKGIKWSNGDEFGSADIAHTVNRWLDPATGSSNLGLFSPMVEEVDGKKQGIPGAVEVVDDYTVQFNLNSAALAMPENFYNYPTAITHRGFGKDYEADLSANPIGTGAFELAEFAVSQKAVLRKARDWWAGPFYLDEIQYIDLGNDSNAQIGAIASDQVDMTYNTPVDQLDVVRRLPNVELHEAVTAQTGVMRMRTTEAPFDNIHVRKAVQLCADRAEMLEVAHRNAGQVAADYHVCQIHPEYFDLPGPTRNIEEAKAELAKGGFEGGIDIEIVVGDTQGPWETAQCEALAAQCKSGRASTSASTRCRPTSIGRSGTRRPSASPAGPTGRSAPWCCQPRLSRSGVPWNESGLQQSGVRRGAGRGRGDARRRGAPQADGEAGASAARQRRHHPAVLAVGLQGGQQAGARGTSRIRPSTTSSTTSGSTPKRSAGIPDLRRFRAAGVGSRSFSATPHHCSRRCAFGGRSAGLICRFSMQASSRVDDDVGPVGTPRAKKRSR